VRKSEDTGRTLGLDVGEARVGLALSDASGEFAQPLTTLEWKGLRPTLAALGEIILTSGVSKLVVGFPLNLDGTAGRRAVQVGLFIRTLRRRFHLPVVSWDERMTTQEARKRIPRTRRRSRRIFRGDLDQQAAAIILQSYLDGQRKGRMNRVLD
jgi:putative Holliday junction resolvase